jgi:transposase
VIVDLEAHTVIDLLPERTAGVVEQWLREHPSIEVISRDRAGAYADGARKGAPEAVQVADRFHLLQNLREALQRLLDRHHTVLRVIPVPESRSQPLPGVETAAVSASSEEDNLPSSAAGGSASAEAPPAASTEAGVTGPARPRRSLCAKDQARRTSRERRQARYAAVMELHSSGLSTRAIAKQLHLSRVTVTRFVAVGSFPERAHRSAQRSILDPFIPFMTERWLGGCDNGMQLWREISEQGYSGSRALVASWVAQHRGVLPAAEEAGVAKRRGRRPREQAPVPEPRSLSARRAAWLLVRRHDDLKQDEQALLEQLREICGAAAVAYTLAQSFTQMVRERNEAALDSWFEAVEESGLAELRTFAAGLRRDEAAVRAGLSLPWSQGQVEGQVNRLKLIKRSGYGRANFDLLRQRVLAA